MLRWVLVLLIRAVLFVPRCLLNSTLNVLKTGIRCTILNGTNHTSDSNGSKQDRDTSSRSIMESSTSKPTRPTTASSFCRLKSVLILLTLSTVVMLLTSLQYVDPVGFRQRAYSFIKYKHNSSVFNENNNNHIKSNNITPVIVLKSKIQSQYERDKKMLSNYSTLFKVPIVNCANIFKGVKHAIDLGIQIAKDDKKKVPMLSDQYYINLTRNCDNFKRTRGYITSYLTKQEKEFPLAYSIVTYKDIEMVEKLLRIVYRPQNFYCIHADLKASKEFFTAATAIAGCFPNVFLSSKRISVQWGTFSVLEPELVCMRELYAKGSWKYFINLTGQEMPLKTNSELVQILTAYQGANDIDATVKRANKERWKGSVPPIGMRALKGSVHIVANRPYIDYILHNENATKLLNWVKKTSIPDETFFTMLNHNPHLGIPGTYTGWPETDKSKRKPFLARFKNWGVEPFKYSCAGYWTRGICILSTGDLPLLVSRREMFANKFHLYEDRVAVGCLEEKLFNDTRDEFLGIKHFNTTYYETLGFVLDQVKKKTTNTTSSQIVLPHTV